MRKDREKAREKVLLDAIGNLPEDMIAKAAEYSAFQKDTEEQGERKEVGDIAFGEEGWQEKKAGKKYRGMVCRVLAAAACLALVMIAGNKGGELFRQYTDKQNIVSEQKKVEHQNAPSIPESPLKSDGKEKEQEVKVWAEAAGGTKDKLKTGKKEINHSNNQTEEESIDKDFMKEHRKELRDGVTRILKTEKVNVGEGEKIPVINLTFGNENEKATYLLHSQIGKIISVTENGVTRYVNLSDADCKAGGSAAFDTRKFAEASWAVNPVPEWESKNIEILDIINVSIQEKSGKVREAGKIVIGVKGKKYYGILKREESNL